MNYDKAIQKYKSLLNAHRGIKEGSGMLQMGVRTHSTDSILGQRKQKLCANTAGSPEVVIKVLCPFFGWYFT